MRGVFGVGVHCGLKQHEHEFWYDVIMVRRNRGRSASTGLNPSPGPLVSTYQTRIADYGDVEPTHGAVGIGRLRGALRWGTA